MQRLPQDLVTPDVLRHGPRPRAGPAGLAVSWRWSSRRPWRSLVRSDSWLRRYKYTWAAAGVGLLLLTFVFGTEINGPAPDAPTRADSAGSRPSCSRSSSSSSWPATCRRTGRSWSSRTPGSGPLRLPPLPYLAPMVAMWAIALGIVVVQRDLGAALLFFAVFLALIYVATGTASAWSSSACCCSSPAAALMAGLFEHVRARIDIWLDPFADPLGAGYQVVQALHRVRPRRPAGRRARRGAADGRRPAADPGRPHRLPAGRARRGTGHRRRRWRSWAAILVVVERGLRIGAAAADDFRALLAVGPGAGHRGPGVHHRGGQPQGPAADGRDAAVHQLRRLVARWRTRSWSVCCSPSRTGASSRHRRPGRPRTRRFALDGPRAPRMTVGEPASRSAPPARSDASSTSSIVVVGRVRRPRRRRPATGAWSRSQDLDRSPYDPAVIAAARERCRAGEILDRDGGRARAQRDATRTGSCTGSIADRAHQPGRRLRVARATDAPASSAPTTPSCRLWPATRWPTPCASSGRSRTTRRTSASSLDRRSPAGRRRGPRPIAAARS